MIDLASLQRHEIHVYPWSRNTHPGTRAKLIRHTHIVKNLTSLVQSVLYVVEEVIVIFFGLEEKTPAHRIGSMIYRTK